MQNIDDRRSGSWEQCNWSKIDQQVHRLQSRIAKAKQKGRSNSVRGLQRLLTQSLNARLLAVKRVTSNKGKNTPGVDGAILSTSAAKWKTAQLLNKRPYKSLPLKRVHIPKKNGGKRPLGIPTMFDRAQQAVHQLALDPVSEVQADKVSYGFRRYRSAQDAMGQCFRLLAKRDSPVFVLEADIKGCFDNISHEWLLNNIPMDKQMLRKWLKAGVMERQSFKPTRSGTPQGGIISPTIANMALDGLEKLLRKQCVKRVGNNTNPRRIYLVRYADDFIVTSNSSQYLEDTVKPLIAQFLAERGLRLSEEKTKITHINDGFDFLGFNFRKYGSKLLTRPSPISYKKITRTLREVIYNSRAMDQDTLIARLNPKIRGWANYYKHVCSKRIFSNLDSELWHMLWNWSKRRHPKKGKRWVVDKYFKTVNGNRWTFQGSKYTLVNPALIPIRRHVDIRHEANPYDPKYRDYYNKRVMRNTSADYPELCRII